MIRLILVCTVCSMVGDDGTFYQLTMWHTKCDTHTSHTMCHTYVAHNVTHIRGTQCHTQCLTHTWHTMWHIFVAHNVTHIRHTQCDAHTWHTMWHTYVTHNVSHICDTHTSHTMWHTYVAVSWKSIEMQIWATRWWEGRKYSANTMFCSFLYFLGPNFSAHTRFL